MQADDTPQEAPYMEKIPSKEQPSGQNMKQENI
jgi:hypothetical protein